jgi:MOSC domain-containing protein YiiM
VFVGPLGLAGDEQADRAHHGGLDKAVCAYPGEHYGWWSQRLDQGLEAGAFGENLTLRGLVESSVCIGDVLRIGRVELQVSQPRRPCFKLGLRHGSPRLALWLQESGLTGFYLRVLSPGWLNVRSEIAVVERPSPGVTVATVNRLLYGTRDAAGLRRALQAEGLSDRLRANLVSLLDGRLEPSRERLFGD